MRNETIAIHAGFDMDTATRSVAVPIYQAVAYGFDHAEHAAALFDLQAAGDRHSRISNPTNTVLEAATGAIAPGGEDQAGQSFPEGRQ